LTILRALATTLGHPAAPFLERCFVHYVATNLPQRARDHFFGLREAKPDLLGIAVFDHLEARLQTGTDLIELMWAQREIENYFCRKSVLLAFARRDVPDDLFGLSERDKRQQAMRDAVREVTEALKTLGKPAPWSAEIKATDDFLDPLFKAFFSKLDLPLTFRKADYHVLASLLPREKIDPEVAEKLDAIVAVASRANPSCVS
jgi:hypothetical protein